MSTTIDQLETPAVLVDRDQLMANIERVQAIATQHRLALRPHAKTHKCVEIAQLQLQRGAVGITTSKPDEASVFIENATVRSITTAYPIVAAHKLERLMRLAQRRECELRVVIDSDAGVDAAAAAARACRTRVAAFIEIDVGLHRCGVAENDPRLLPLAQQIIAEPHLEFAGLLSHAGHAYGAANRNEIVGIAAEECATLMRVVRLLQASGIEVAEVSVGSTPTVLAGEDFGGITEIRPGNYVFLDATAVRLGIAQIEDVALSVLATVVTMNERYWIVDAGSKVLSSDLGAHGTAATASYGIAIPLQAAQATPLSVTRLSEEHGWIDRSDVNLQIGDRVRIVPNHACPVANLADQLAVVSGEYVVDQWPVAARGKVR